jgi:hypothetical protein
MRRRTLKWTLGLALVTSCMVQETVAVSPIPPGCDWIWVDGHPGPWGGWHPAHWRCIGYPDEIVMAPY